jgi:hypothetical protein
MGDSITYVVFSLIAADATASSGAGVPVSTWLIPTLFTLLSGVIWWFVRDKFTSMEKTSDKQYETLTSTDERIERTLDKNLGELQIGVGDIAREVKSIDRRVLRIETNFGLSPLVSGSPLKLTEVGEKILNESGIKEAADTSRENLLEAIKGKHPESAYDVQKITRHIFQNIAWSPHVVKSIKEYSYQSGQWGLSDILDVGAIYFRDIALKEFGYEVKDVDASDPERQQ